MSGRGRREGGECGPTRSDTRLSDSGHSRSSHCGSVWGPALRLRYVVSWL